MSLHLPPRIYPDDEPVRCVCKVCGRTHTAYLDPQGNSPRCCATRLLIAGKVSTDHYGVTGRRGQKYDPVERFPVMRPDWRDPV